jgi:hypothetical protein
LMPKKGTEQREHPRVEARLAMQLAEETLGDALVTTESLNISRGGVYCESQEYLAPLSKVALTVILPGFGAPRGRSRMLRCEGVVVRCEQLPPMRARKRYQLACCFTGLDNESRTLLDDFVAWRALSGRKGGLARRPVGKIVGRVAASDAPAKRAVRKKAAGKRATGKSATGKSPTGKKATARAATARSTASTKRTTRGSATRPPARKPGR